MRYSVFFILCCCSCLFAMDDDVSNNDSRVLSGTNMRVVSFDGTAQSSHINSERLGGVVQESDGEDDDAVCVTTAGAFGQAFERGSKHGKFRTAVKQALRELDPEARELVLAASARRRRKARKLAQQSATINLDPEIFERRIKLKRPKIASSDDIENGAIGEVQRRGSDSSASSDSSHKIKSTLTDQETLAMFRALVASNTHPEDREDLFRISIGGDTKFVIEANKKKLAALSAVFTVAGFFLQIGLSRWIVDGSCS